MKWNVYFSRVILAGVFAVTAATSAFAQLNRVGPVGPLGYPEWYQDKTGLTLEFCDSRTPAELEGGWCVLLPPDVPAGAPESRTGSPVNFGDEHFYYVLNAGGAGVPIPGQAGVTTRVLLVAAIEGAFANEAVIAGDEMVFARLRIRIDTLPYSGTYKVYTPFGKRVFEDQVAGERLFVTEDIGITAGNFQEALNGSIYPFLLPSAVPGGPEMPPVSASNPAPDQDPAHFGGGTPTPYPGNGRRYIADPARLGPITGSLANFSGDGIANPNIFRIDIEGPDVPNGRVTLYSTTDFSLAGRIYEGPITGRVSVDRASYARNASGEKIDLYVTATPITRGRIPGEAPAAPIPSNLVYFNGACTSALDANGNPFGPYGPANAAAPSVQLLNSGSTYFAQYGTVPNGMAGCLSVNAATTNGQATTAYLPVTFSDQITITEAKFDAAAQTLTIRASSSDETLAADGVTPLQTLTAPGFGILANGQLVVNQLLAPPATIQVSSSGRGSNTHQVTTGMPVAAGSGGGTGGGSTGGGTTPEPVPVASNVGAATFEGVATPIELTNDPSLSIVLLTNGTLGTVTLGAQAGTVIFTPNVDASGTDTFAFQLRTASGLTSNTATDTVTIAPANDAPTAVAETVNAIANASTSVNLLSNDTDPDGAEDLARVVIDSADPRLGTVTVDGGVVTFKPQALPSGTTSVSVPLTYHAVDTSNAASSSVTSTIRIFATETIAPVRWQYTTSQNRWVVSGTVSPNMAQTMRITYAAGTYNVWSTSQNRFVCGGNAAGTLVGTAVTDGTGTWTFDQSGINPNSLLNPTNSNNNATAPNGARTNFWCTTPTVRITSLASGASVLAGPVQVK
jgi:hypothetical protein